MKAIITIRLCAESREELIQSFAGKYRLFRDHIDDLAREGNFPPNTELRWLLTSGRWD